MARRSALLPALGILLAGCAAPIAENSILPGVVPDVLPTLVAAFNAVVDAAGGQGEPSLGVTPDGVLFTHGRSPGVAFGRGGGTVYRSIDDGRTWEKVGTPHDPFPDLDPDLAVDKEGVVWDDILYVGCNSVAVSKDQGKTWARHPAVCNLPVGDRQYVIPTTGGTAYLYYHQLPTFEQRGMKTTDYGLTWVPTGPMEGLAPHHLVVNGGSGWGGGGFWNEKTGSVFATYTWFDGNPTAEPSWQPAASVTRDGGLTWDVTKAATAGGTALGLSLVQGAADADGNVYLAWAEGEGDGAGVYFASSTDDGATWSAPKRVDAAVGSVVLPAIAARGSGEVAVAYYETAEEALPGETSKEATWNVTLAWTRDALADSPTWTRGQLSETPAKVGPICADGSVCRGDRQLLDYFQIRVLPDGRVAAIWTSTVAVEDKVVNVVAPTTAAVFGATS